MAKQITGDRCKRCNGAGTIIADCGGFNAQVDCPDCHGTGVVNSPDACTKCHGKGTVLVNMGFMVEASCDHCNGTGLEPLGE